MVKSMLSAATVAILASSISAAKSRGSGTRDVVSFDFGWQHRPGLSSWAGPDDRPPTWNAIYSYLATNDNHPAEATVGYNDSDWLNVQLPHDGLIAAAPSQTACPDGCSGKSYIP